MADPLYGRFLEQRRRAKCRGIAWELPYWQWLQIWEESGRLPERGPPPRRVGDGAQSRSRSLLGAECGDHQSRDEQLSGQPRAPQAPEAAQLAPE
jgi:hypothetical protein